MSKEQFLENEVEVNNEILDDERNEEVVLNCESEDFDKNAAEKFEKEIEEDISKDNGKIMKEAEACMGDSLYLFMQDMKQFQMLTPEQEKALIKLAKTGKKECDRQKAKERLLLCNWRLVVYAAKKFRNLGVDFEDLISQGMIGLMTGIEKFDYKAKTRLSTYVLYWIRQSISRYVADNGRTIRLPVHVNDKLSKYKKVKKELTLKYGKEPKIEDIAKKLKVSVKSLEELIQASMDTTSLDKELGDEEDTKLSDLIADENAISPEKNTEKLFIGEKLRDAISTLKEKEQQVINLRHGMNDDKVMTLEQVGEIMGITRERVRQIEDIAFRKLRRKLPELEEYVA